MTQFICRSGGSVNGNIRVPGDKSISHRSIILSSIAEGISQISGFLQGEDSLNTIKAFQQMGVSIDRDMDRVKVIGVGLHGLNKPDGDLDMGNSPTQEVRIREFPTASGFEVRVSWVNAEYFPSTPIGSLEVTIKSSGTVEIDHTGINIDLGRGITGLSSGENAGGTTVTAHDFYSGGLAPNAFSSSSFRDTIYQNFNGTAPETPSNLYTLCFQPQNPFGSYDMAGVFITQSCL